MATNVDEFRIGPFIFEYDPDRSEMYISREEESLGMCEIFDEDWDNFVKAAGPAMGTLKA